MSGTRLFAVLVLSTRGEIRVGDNPTQVPLKLIDRTSGMVGVLPVFRSREEAVAQFPGGEVVEVSVPEGSNLNPEW